MFAPFIVFLNITLFLSLAACSGVSNKPEDDPLKNTKRLVKEGHVSLYENGALNVPNTKIMLIPPGPSTLDFALELSGVRAKESFLTSLANARDAVYMVRDGTRKSFKVAGGIIEGTDEVSQSITNYSRTNAKLLVYRAYPTTQHIIGETFQFSDEVASDIEKIAISMREESDSYARSAESRHKFYEKFATSSVDFSVRSVSRSGKEVASDFKKIEKNFIKGYLALPEKWKSHESPIKKGLEPFKKNWQRSKETRSDLSEHFTEILAGTGNSYTKNISESLSKSKDALSSASDTGVGLAALDSVRWLLQALLWDATIAPLSKIGYASVGYVTSNTVVFPVMVVAGEGYAVTKVAVEVVVDSGRKTIDVVAPTFEAALASTYAISAFAVKSVGGAALGGAGVVASSAVGAADAFSALTIQTAGNATGYGIEYIGVPLTTAGVKIGGATAGVVVGSAKTVAGSTLFITGEAGAIATTTAGYTTAGGVAVAGTALSTTALTGLGVYELAKAVAVPTSYELGSGIVLGYSSMSHIAAHTILSAADASYLVLSLEGPRWVIYAVKGNLNDGETLVPGTVLDLNRMQDEGEEFSFLPASEDELQTVVREVKNDLLFETEEEF